MTMTGYTGHAKLVAKEQTFPVACSFCSRYEGGTPRVAIGLEA